MLDKQRKSKQLKQVKYGNGKLSKSTIRAFDESFEDQTAEFIDKKARMSNNQDNV